VNAVNGEAEALRKLVAKDEKIAKRIAEVAKEFAQLRNIDVPPEAQRDALINALRKRKR